MGWQAPGSRRGSPLAVARLTRPREAGELVAVYELARAPARGEEDADGDPERGSDQRSDNALVSDEADGLSRLNRRQKMPICSGF
jgi:hypothetical protein